MKSRYCFNPLAKGRIIGRRVTPLYRIRQAIARSRAGRPDMYEIIGYNAPVFPHK